MSAAGEALQSFTVREFTARSAVFASVFSLALGAFLGAFNLLFSPRVPLLSLPLSLFGMAAAGPALLMAIAFTILLVRGKRLNGLMLGALVLCFGSSALGAGTLGAWSAFERNKRAWLDDAIEYCDRVRPELERARAEHGAYPRDLDSLHVDRPRPFLARTGDLQYSASAQRYEIEINTSRGLAFFGASFESDIGSWKFVE